MTTAIQETPTAAPEQPYRWVDGKPPRFEYDTTVPWPHSGVVKPQTRHITPALDYYDRLKQLYDRCLWFEAKVAAQHHELEQLRMAMQTVETEDAPKRRKG